MPSRKFQPKRKQGCTTCKSRKVRCDLAQPVCANCIRLHRDCIYDHAQFTTAKALIPPSLPGGDPVDILSLRLMHHYTESTCFEMSDNPDHLKVWQHNIPEIAFQHRFVLHGILALSALHLRRGKDLEEATELLHVAHSHQAQALAEFIPLLSSLTDDNCHALFAFTFVVAAVSYALIGRVGDSSAEPAFIDDLLATFDLLKGAMTVAVSAKDMLRSGTLASLMDDGHPLLDRNQSAADSQLPNDLQRLLDHIEASEAFQTSSSLHCHKHTIMKLTVLSSPTTEGTPRLAAVLGWPVLVQADFLKLLRGRDSAAMTVLAFYGAILHQLDHVWYLQGLGASIVTSVVASVQAEWLPFLDSLKPLAR